MITENILLLWTFKSICTTDKMTTFNPHFSRTERQKETSVKKWYRTYQLVCYVERKNTYIHRNASTGITSDCGVQQITRKLIESRQRTITVLCVCITDFAGTNRVNNRWLREQIVRPWSLSHDSCAWPHHWGGDSLSLQWCWVVVAQARALLPQGWLVCRSAAPLELARMRSPISWQLVLIWWVCCLFGGYSLLASSFVS